MDAWTVHTIERLNRPYTRNHNDGQRTAGAPFRVIGGTIPVLLSAPHAVGQYHGSARKASDAHTGGLLEYLCRRTGAHGISRVFNAGDNPNADPAGWGLQYRQRAAQQIRDHGIRYLLDLHGCTDDHGFALELGTFGGETVQADPALIDWLRLQLAPLGTVSCDTVFRASSPHTVSRDVYARTGIACVQLELSRSLRTQQLARTARLLEQVIDGLARREV